MTERYMTHHVTGLTDAEVEVNRNRYGRNILTPPEREPVWLQFIDKFKDPLIVILMVAGIMSIGIAFYEYYCLHQGPGVFFEPVGIFMAIILATGLAFYFELEAAKEFELLNKISDDEPVEVIRCGHICKVAKSDVVVGDIVRLETGQEIPADGELIEAVCLTVDESTLTGEPACGKTVLEDEFDSEATFRSDQAMRGSKVMEGHGLMRVTAVGDATEDGKVFSASQIDTGEKTPLREQLDRLGTLISRGSYIVAALIVVGRLIMYFGLYTFDWMGFVTHMLSTVMIAVTLIVVAVPEGLPMAVTLSLAYSMRRMLKSNNLVRKLHACETMGAATVICTDKTGTLTQNLMTVCDYEFYGDIPPHLIDESVAVNSTAELGLKDDKLTVIGNPTEGALLLWLKSRGADYRGLRGDVVREAELPFSPERKYMATIVRSSDGHRRLYVKGAPEIVMGLCTGLPVDRAEIDAALQGYQSQAMRTLGMAYRELAQADPLPLMHEGLFDAKLTFMGIIAIADPVRPDVAPAINEVTQAGIKVKVVTGDTPATAREIASQIGLWHEDDGTDAIITGSDFAALSDEEALDRVGKIKIMARARPMDKKRLVELLQRRGEVVAVTGDGTNDAPALKAAHVGLAMGDGTAVAKEAGDITIIDNSFVSISKAVMWGRSLYLNIRRFIMFQLTVNVAACLIVLAGAYMGVQSPLNITQMLWVNLIMDSFAAVALASLPPSSDVMRDKPRNRRDSILSPAMTRFILMAGVAFFAAMLGLLVYFDHTDLESLTEFGRVEWRGATEMNPHEVSIFFSIFVFLQFWNMFNVRAYGTGQSVFRLDYGKGFSFIMALIFIGQVTIVELGGEFMGVVPLSMTDWVIIIMTTSSVLWIGEILRLGSRRD